MLVCKSSEIALKPGRYISIESGPIAVRAPRISGNLNRCLSVKSVSYHHVKLMYQSLSKTVYKLNKNRIRIKINSSIFVKNG